MSRRSQHRSRNRPQIFTVSLFNLHSNDMCALIKETQSMTNVLKVKCSKNKNKNRCASPVSWLLTKRKKKLSL